MAPLVGHSPPQQPEGAKEPSPVIRPTRTSSLSQSDSNPPNPQSRHPYAKKLAPLATANINAMFVQQSVLQTNASTAGSSMSIQPLSEEPSPITPLSPPLSRRLPTLPVDMNTKIRFGGSRSAAFGVPRRVNRLNFIQRSNESVNRSSMDSSTSLSNETSLSSEEISHLSRHPTHSSSSVISNDSKKFQGVIMVGRGGAGRRARPPKQPKEASVTLPSQSSSQSPPQTINYVRPMGRGGLGSRPKKSPATNAQSEPSKIPRKSQSTPNIAELLNLRKSKKSKGKEKATESIEAPTISPYDFSATSVDQPRPPKVVRSGINLDNGDSSDVFSPPVSATSATFEAAYEEYERRRQEKQRDRSASKLARTLGDTPIGLIEALTGKRETKTTHRPTGSLDPSTSTKRSPFRNSLTSFTSYNTSVSELHKHDLDGNFSSVWGDETNRSHSPLMFAPPSPTLLVPPTRVPPLSGVQSHFPPCDTFSEYGDNKSPKSTSPGTLTTDDSSSFMPLTPTDFNVPELVVSESLPPSPSLSIYQRTFFPGSQSFLDEDDRAKSHSHIHFTSFSTTQPIPPPNTPAKHIFPASLDVPSSVPSSWLVPPSPTQMDEDAILVSGRGDSEIRVSGEWNVNMRDVIQALRELR